jgi:hypothetical protein
MTIPSGQCKPKSEEQLHREELLRTLKGISTHLSNIAWYFMLLFVVSMGQCLVSLHK